MSPSYQEVIAARAKQLTASFFRSQAKGSTMNEDSDASNLVEEFPKPPFYYKSICASDPPPLTPIDVDPYTIVYGGSFAVATLLPKTDKSGPIFAEEIKE
ncbi:hypothetical protein EON65_00795 [archaeon]|nr:MAG: hypothetical protein EON65_00795 [archaeon]